MNVVKKEGFDLEVLEKTLSKSFSKINMELFRFIKENVYADAYLADGRQAARVASRRDHSGNRHHSCAARPMQHDRKQRQRVHDERGPRFLASLVDRARR